jgi:hypothetical protein
VSLKKKKKKRGARTAQLFVVNIVNGHRIFNDEAYKIAKAAEVKQEDEELQEPSKTGCLIVDSYCGNTVSAV